MDVLLQTVDFPSYKELIAISPEAMEGGPSLGWSEDIISIIYLAGY